MCDREAARQRLRKILALIEGAKTEQEAVAATLALQRVMASTGVGVEEVDADGVDDVTIDSTREEARVERWVRELALAIAENLRCQCLISAHRKGNGTTRYRFSFYGVSGDAQLARKTFEAMRGAAVTCFRRWARDVGAERRDPLTNRISSYDRNSYYLGFAAGVRHAMVSQREAISETSLALSVPATVTSAVERDRTGTMRNGRIEFGDGNAYQRGVADGGDVARCRTLA